MIINIYYNDGTNTNIEYETNTDERRMFNKEFTRAIDKGKSFVITLPTRTIIVNGSLVQCVIMKKEKING